MTVDHPTPFSANQREADASTDATPAELPLATPAPTTASTEIVNNDPNAYRPFVFDGGAGTYVGTAILAALLTVITIGIATPWAICMLYRWRTEHTIVNGYRLRFTGTGGGVFGNWIKWWLLIIVTLGIYSFWVVPRLTKWTVEHQEFTRSV